MRSTTTNILHAIAAASALVALAGAPVHAQTTVDMGKDSSMGTTSATKPGAGSGMQPGATYYGGSTYSYNNGYNNGYATAPDARYNRTVNRDRDNHPSATGDSGAGQVSRGEVGSGRTTDSKSTS